MTLRVLNPSDTLWSPSAKQQRLIDCLLAPPFPTLQDAAKIAGIPYQTAKRWNRDQRFVSVLKAQGSEQYAEGREIADRKLRGLISEALRVKEEALHSGELKLANSAADWILERFVMSAYSLADEEQRRAFEDAVLDAVAEVAPEVQGAIVSNLRRRLQAAESA